MKKIIIDLIGIAAILALFLGVNYLTYNRGYKKGEANAIEKVIFVHDTTTIYDTTIHYKPKYITSVVTDSIPYPVYIREGKDTVYMPLPRTVREYGDSTYHAIISGIEPNLDRIDIFQKTQYINNTVYVPTKDTRSNYVEFNAKLMYDKVSFAPITIDFGYIRGAFEAYAGGGYDPMTKSLIGEVGTRIRFRY